MTVDILPWHQAHWQRLNDQIEKASLPHALLIAGPPMSGKQGIARALVERLLCQGKDAPCGECHQCQLVSAGTLPDLLHVTLEDSKQILINQIRGLIDWASQTSQQGGYKVCLIDPADRLNIQSANALLKCLEEPPAGTCILLITDQPKRLLPTIRSRCHLVNCRLPESEEALAWLQERNESGIDTALLLEIAGGLPLKAVASVTDGYLALRKKLADLLTGVTMGSESPIQFAAGVAGEDPTEVLDILYQLIADTIGITLCGEVVIRNSDLKIKLDEFASAVKVERRFELLDRIAHAKGLLGSTSNANPQMLFESLFIEAA
ncbi:MAG: DNA polymerase III subunit delta' [Gammaproteobacteria bacterium]|nr:DNA polymerase III subunit delta' [Gammaproteobacteria bacterium]